jgi:hypothetical protein
MRKCEIYVARTAVVSGILFFATLILMTFFPNYLAHTLVGEPSRAYHMAAELFLFLIGSIWIISFGSYLFMKFKLI